VDFNFTLKVKVRKLILLLKTPLEKELLWMVLGNHSDGPKRISEGGILCSLDNPVKHRKMCNMFKFSAKDLEKVQNMFDEI